MILFLTYHKVLAETGDREDADFYSVTRSSFVQQITALQAAGYAPLDFDQLRQPTNPYGKNFILGFDDGTVDHYNVVWPALQQANLRGVFFVPTGKLNRPGYLTEQQVRELAVTGQQIGCHSHEHKRLDTMNDGEIYEQLQVSRDRLAGLTGQAPWLFAPPGGFINERVRNIALSLGLSVIRTMQWGFNVVPDLAGLQTVPLNRHIGDRQFQRILSGKSPRLAYAGKEAVKALLPARAYEQLRGWLFKLAKRS